MSAPTYCGEVTVLGGGVQGYASAHGIALVTYDQVGPWTKRAAGRLELSTDTDVAQQLAYYAGRCDRLVVLLGLTWRKHVEMRDAARDVVVGPDDYTIAVDGGGLQA